MNEHALENLPRTASVCVIHASIFITTAIALWPSAWRGWFALCVLYPELRRLWVMVRVDWPHGTSCWELINLTNVIDLKQWAQLKWWGWTGWAGGILTSRIGTIKLTQSVQERENNLVVSFRSNILLDGGKCWVLLQHTQSAILAWGLHNWPEIVFYKTEQYKPSNSVSF